MAEIIQYDYGQDAGAEPPFLAEEWAPSFLGTAVVEAYREVIIPRHRDPFTLPKDPKTKCLKKKYGICYEWSVKSRYYYNTAYLVVDVVEVAGAEKKVRAAVIECLRETTIALLVSKLIDATLGGVTTYVTTTLVIDRLYDCLKAKLKGIEIVRVDIETEGEWGPHE